MHYDVVVIGSGFGGSVSAYELSKAGLNVCLVERGPWRESSEVSSSKVQPVSPLPSGFAFVKLALYKLHHALLPGNGFRLNQNGLFEMFMGRDINVLCSNGVGGGSHVYLGLHGKPFDKNYWNGITEELSSDVMNEHYSYILDLFGSKPAPQYDDVNDHNLSSEFPDLPEEKTPWWGYAKSNNSATWHKEIRFENEGMFGSPDGHKNTLDRILLLPAIKEFSLTIKALLEVLTIEKNENGFIVYMKNHLTGKEEVIESSRVILAAGSLNSFKIIARSVEQKLLPELNNIGKGFSANADIMGFWKATDNRGKFFGPYERIFSSSDESEQLEIVQSGASGLTRLPIPSFIRRKIESFRFLAAMGVDDANGHIHIKNNRITINYSEKDNPIIATIKNHFVRIGQISGFQVIVPGKLTTVHPIGGLIISETKETGVVNSYGELFSTPGLYVCDSSVFPKALGAPPSLSVAAWARHVCSELLRDIKNNDASRA